MAPTRSRRSQNLVVTAAAAILFLCATSDAQILRLVKDIDPRPPTRSSGTAPTDLTIVGELTYFVLGTAEYGTELWVTDGTRAGTRLVRDIRVGKQSASPRLLTPLGATLFFTADDGVHGRELWKSDGTPAGTRLVADLRPGPVTSDIREMAATSRRIYFRANDGITGAELWRTAGGTPTLMLDMVRGADGSGPSELTTVGEVVCFSAADGVTGREPYRAVGETIRTLGDVNPGAENSNPREFARDPTSSEGFFFSAEQAGRGREPVVFRGGKVFPLRDIRTGPVGSEPDDVVTVGNKTFFTADDGQTGRELYVFDGTAPRRLRDIRTGTASPTIRDVVAFGTGIVFAADDGTHGRELWTSDGTTPGTKLLADLHPGSASSKPGDLVALAGKVYFAANTPTVGRELFETDGTTAGSKLSVDVHPSGSGNPRLLVGSGNTLSFAADLVNFGRQVARMDVRTKAVTHPRVLNPVLQGSNPTNFFQIPGTSSVLFQASSPATGRELFKSDGTKEGTVLVKDISPGVFGSTPSDFAEARDRIFFLAQQSLFETDATTTGTVRITGTDARLENLASCTGNLYMRANDFRGLKPFVFDPDTNRFTDLSDAISGETLLVPEDFSETTGGCLFTALFARRGRQVFFTDGTKAGTRMVSNFANGQIRDLARMSDGLALFVARVDNREILFVTDGTTAGTKPLLAGSNVIENPREIVAIENARKPRAYLIGEPSRGRRVIFKTDGKTASIVGQLINSGDQDPRSLTPTGTGMFWSAIDENNGREYFFSKNGGPARRIGDLQKGKSPSLTTDAAAVALGAGSEGLFVADDGLTGQEIWTTSGSPKSTKLLIDAVPGAEGLRPREMTQAGALVFFAADDGVTGLELYVLDQRPLGASLAVKIGKKCKLKGKKPPEIGFRGIPELGSIDLSVVAKTSKKRTPVVMFFGAQRIAADIGPCQFSVVTLFTLIGATNDQGVADLPIAIPNDLELIGTTFRTQFAVVSPGGSIAGLFDLTDGLEVVVGKRSDD